MFNIGPLELLVLAIVGLVVLGPDRLPELARDAGRLLRTLRDLATGARQQLREELGPEFADVDLRNLNPKTAVQRAVFGDGVDLTKYHPRNALQDMLLGDDTGEVPGGYVGGGDDVGWADVPDEVVKPQSGEAPRPRPRPGPGPAASGPPGSGPAASAENAPPFDMDAT